MKTHKLEYVKWEDVEKELCKNIGIDRTYFRDYHNLDKSAGKYCDFWHVWIFLWGEHIKNDSYDRYFFSKFDWEYHNKRAKEKYGEWAIKLVDAVKKMVEENFKYEEEVVIYYSW